MRRAECEDPQGECVRVRDAAAVSAAAAARAPPAALPHTI